MMIAYCFNPVKCTWFHDLFIVRPRQERQFKWWRDMDLANLFSRLEDSDKRIVIDKLDASVDRMIKDGKEDEDSIEEAIEDLRKFADIIRMTSKYSIPQDDEYR